LYERDQIARPGLERAEGTRVPRDGAGCLPLVEAERGLAVTKTKATDKKRGKPVFAGKRGAAPSVRAMILMAVLERGDLRAVRLF
jgi:hypothetical protein